MTPSPDSTRVLSYRDHQLVTAFVFLAKRRGVGAKLNELSAALNLADNSASVGKVVQRLEVMQLITKVRMDAEPRRPWRIYSHPYAWHCAGQLSFERWRNG